MDTCTRIHHHHDVMYLWLTVCKNIPKKYSISTNTFHNATLSKNLDNFPLQTIKGYQKNRICCHKWQPLDILSLIIWSYCQQIEPINNSATINHKDIKIGSEEDTYDIMADLKHANYSKPMYNTYNSSFLESSHPFLQSND